MARIGYCSECGRYVRVTAEGACENSHPRSALRDVREGPLAEAPVAAAAPAETPADATFREDGGLAAQILGKAIVLVPIALVVAWGLWTGYEQFPGMPPMVRIGLSAGSLVLTFLVAWIWFGLRKRR